MSAKARGAVVERTGRDRLTYRSLRFTAGGKRRWIPLGTVSATEAATTLRHTLADVGRGTWTPPQREVVREPGRRRHFALIDGSDVAFGGTWDANVAAEASAQDAA